MTNRIRAFLVGVVAYVTAFFHRDLDALVGGLNKTVARIDALVAREQAKRIAVADQIGTLYDRIDVLRANRVASFATTERAQRVRDKVADLIA